MSVRYICPVCISVSVPCLYLVDLWWLSIYEPRRTYTYDRTNEPL